jgi:hypothetical protein
MKHRKIINFVNEQCPSPKTVFHHELYRHECVNFLSANDCIGIELGVAAGHFSQRMVQSGKFRKFYGVDLYEDHHDTHEYKSAIKLVGLDSNYTLLRMSFDEAIELFDDNYFDFIYFDGYAHTGEEGGKTFADWYKKLKVGGMFAGDDYHDDWPLVKWAVNDMATKIGCEINVTGKNENTIFNEHPTWFFTKKAERDFVPNEKLSQIGAEIREKTRQTNGKQLKITKQNLIQIVKKIKAEDPIFAQQIKALI